MHALPWLEPRARRGRPLLMQLHAQQHAHLVAGAFLTIMLEVQSLIRTMSSLMIKQKVNYNIAARTHHDRYHVWI